VPQAPRTLTPDASAQHFFGSELRRLRNRAGLSIDDLGRLVGYSGDTVAKLEKAERWPRDAEILAKGADEVLGSDGALTRLLPLVLAERQRARDARDPGEARVPATSPFLPVLVQGHEVELDDQAGVYAALAQQAGEVTGGLMAVLERARREMDRTLSTTTVTQGQLDRLDDAILGYRQEYVVRPPVPMLGQLLLDFSDVQQLTATRQPTAVQVRLSRAAALLAVLAADALMKLGRTREAKAWYGTARLASEETGDPLLIALVRTGGDAVVLLRRPARDRPLGSRGAGHRRPGGGERDRTGRGGGGPRAGA
jgi:DNA-binding XRE family transcriptional regulator